MMRNPIFDKLLETLTHGGIFSHTNVGHAEVFFNELNPDELDRVAVAVVGDSHLTNKVAVSNCITAVLSVMERRDNITIHTGCHDGVEAYARAYAKRNQMELVVHKALERPYWESASIEYRRERDRRIVAASHVVLVITDGKSKESKFIASHAIQEGRLVTLRTIKVPKP